VENAIVHGLAPKKDNKVLRVMVILNHDHLEFVVRDNGVGRNYSKNISKEMNPAHKSMAMDLTKRRIELMDAGNTDKRKIVIDDLIENGEPVGTAVRFSLPLQAHHEQY
jgi:LytS/YehU family sensor histidine kinase